MTASDFNMEVNNVEADIAGRVITSIIYPILAISLGLDEVWGIWFAKQLDTVTFSFDLVAYSLLCHDI